MTQIISGKYFVSHFVVCEGTQASACVPWFHFLVCCFWWCWWDTVNMFCSYRLCLRGTVELNPFPLTSPLSSLLLQWSKVCSYTAVEWNQCAANLCWLRGCMYVSAGWPQVTRLNCAVCVHHLWAVFPSRPLAVSCLHHSCVPFAQLCGRGLLSWQPCVCLESQSLCSATVNNEEKTPVCVRALDLQTGQGLCIRHLAVFVLFCVF